MFNGCSSLTTLDLSSWNTSKVSAINAMFWLCSNLTTLDLSSWDTSSVMDMNSMFYGCSGLTTLDVSSWDTSKVTSMGNMFNDCSSLTTLDLSSWNTSKVTDVSFTFACCYILTVVYAGDDWSTAAVTESSNMFLDCEAIVGGSGTTYDSSKRDATMANWETGYLTYKKDLDSETIAKLEKAAETRNLSTLTLDELGAVAGDLEANGTSSKAYSAAKACAQAGAYRTTTYNNTTVYMTLVSVLHDEDADGNALGLTWMLSGGAVSEDALMGTGDGVDTMAMNSSNTNTDGWGASAGRTTLNSTVLSNLNESGLSALIKARKVPYGPTYISTSAFVSHTTDKLWLMSYHEVYGLVTSSYSDRYDMTRYKYLANEGGQMDWFSANNVSQSNFSKLVGGNTTRFLRSCSSYIVGNSFGTIYYGDGGPNYDSASYPKAVFPCFSM